MDGMLSQEEINALLSGLEPEPSSEDSQYLTDMEKDTLGEISNISMGTAATTLSSLLNQKVNISTPIVSYAKWDDLVLDYDRPCVFLQISYKEGLNGNNILILKEKDVKIITDLMMGGDGTNLSDELTDLHLSAIGEAMNQMMGSAATSISSMLGIKIDIRPPIASLVDLNENVDKDEIREFLIGTFVKISFKMTIGELIDSDIMQLYPIDFAKDLCSHLGTNSDQEDKVEQEPIPQNNNQEIPNPNNNQFSGQQNPQMQMQQTMGMGQPYMQPYPQMQQGNMPYNGAGYSMQMPQMQMPQMQMPQMQMPQMQDINVQPAQFQTFSGDLGAATHKENIDLIMDVPLEVTAELGRTSKSIQDILEFSPGTIIELNKIAGEPIDVLVNGKLVAKGEVVVIEESFGVRVTEIIKENTVR